MPRDILPEPPDDLKRHSERLRARILAAIGTSGEIPFEQYMEMALYEPGLGYYSAGLHKLGRSGDFVTAPEIGSLFAACMASQCADIGEELGAYEVLEVGAGTGRLAADLLRQVNPSRAPVRYRILERSADLQRVQKDRISREAPAWADRVEWLKQPPVEAWQGVLIANEVIDALSAECFEIRDGGVHQLCVTHTSDGLGWSTRPAPEGLEAAVRHLEKDTGLAFAQGYRSEIRPRLAAWLDSLTATLSRGLALFIGVAAVVNGQLVMRFGMHRLTRRALYAVTVLSWVLLSLSGWFAGHPPLFAFIAVLVGWFFCMGVVFGNINAMAMEPLGHVAGSAAAVIGTASTLMAVGLGYLVGGAYDGTLLPMAVGFAVLLLVQYLLGALAPPLMIAVLPALLGWVALLLPWPEAGVLLAIGFAVMYLFDRRAWSAQPWFQRLRLHLSATAILCLVSGAAFAFGPA